MITPEQIAWFIAEWRYPWPELVKRYGPTAILHIPQEDK